MTMTTEKETESPDEVRNGEYGSDATITCASDTMI